MVMALYFFSMQVLLSKMRLKLRLIFDNRTITKAGCFANVYMTIELEVSKFTVIAANQAPDQPPQKQR